jgi:hypothetical protein
MAGLILEIQLDAWQSGQRQWDQMRIGTALEIRLDDTDGFTRPLAGIIHGVFSQDREDFQTDRWPWARSGSGNTRYQLRKKPTSRTGTAKVQCVYQLPECPAQAL